MKEPTVVCDGAQLLELCTALFEAGCNLRFRARGFSMYPLIRDGDVVEVEKYGAEAIRVGDIILFRSLPNGAVIHRVIRKVRSEEADLLVTQGDSACHPDNAIKSDQVLGRIVSVERDGRRVRLKNRVFSWIVRVPLGLRYRGTLFSLAMRLSNCPIRLMKAERGLDDVYS